MTDVRYTQAGPSASPNVYYRDPPWSRGSYLPDLIYDDWAAIPTGQIRKLIHLNAGMSKQEIVTMRVNSIILQSEPGTDRKAWKRGFLQLSRVRVAETLPELLFGIESLRFESTIFYHELIPLEYVMSKHWYSRPNCGLVSIQLDRSSGPGDSGSLKSYAGSAKKLIDRGFVWIQSSGDLSVGVGGPCLDRVWEISPIIEHKTGRGALAINAYDEGALLSYISDCVSDRQFLTSCYLVNTVDFLEMDTPLCPGTVLKLPDLDTVGQYPSDFQPWELKYACDSVDGVEIEGRFCFPFTGLSSFTPRYEFGSSTDWFNVAGGWLAESERIFSHQDECADDYAVIYGAILSLDVNLAHSHDIQPQGRHDLYLCLTPPPERWTESEITSWIFGDYYYWSSDAAGRTRISDDEGRKLRTPPLVPSIRYVYQTWDQEMYESVVRARRHWDLKDYSSTFFELNEGYIDPFTEDESETGANINKHIALESHSSISDSEATLFDLPITNLGNIKIFDNTGDFGLMHPAQEINDFMLTVAAQVDPSITIAISHDEDWMELLDHDELFPSRAELIKRLCSYFRFVLGEGAIRLEIMESVDHDLPSAASDVADVVAHIRRLPSI
ncbi:hypothetical protein E1B28_003794 [Marasmius oreades]|uniref:Uncharacterized protein n=1 Tax=Marasmius oreades TaxID=181124 RepID=A0A9P7UXE2_9AGAR|nr:uncharacterized protein E1B28_003794 [Marasmius oreades]KAG7096350.1 hypothetical protein E1B28_003794 [Marasmius oreades]